MEKKFDFNEKKMYWDEDVLHIKNEARRYLEEQRLAAEGILPVAGEESDEEEMRPAGE